MPRYRHCIALVVVSAGALLAIGEDKKPADLFAGFTSPKPLEPSDSAKAFDLTPGFKIELVASEPLIRSPVAMDFDENGRLFVAEFPEYNQYANPNPPRFAAGS